MNQQIDEKKLITLFIRKYSQLFNLQDKNANLQAKITQNKKEFNWLKSEIEKLHAKLKNLINTASI